MTQGDLHRRYGDGFLVWGSKSINMIILSFEENKNGNYLKYWLAWIGNS